MTKKKLLEQLDRVRVLETSFPAYSHDGVVRERKCHFLLTYTPPNFPMAREEYALDAQQVQDLFNNIYEYVLNSTTKKKAKKKGKAQLDAYTSGKTDTRKED